MKNWKDIYHPPFRLGKYGSWVHDSAGNFVFQFEPKFDKRGDYVEGYKELEKKLLDCINGKSVERTNNKAVHKESEIFIDDVHLITI